MPIKSDADSPSRQAGKTSELRISIHSDQTALSKSRGTQKHSGDNQRAAHGQTVPLQSSARNFWGPLDSIYDAVILHK